MSNLILVNLKKKLRAERIAEVLKRSTRTDEEVALKSTFSKLVKDDNVADKDVVEYVYGKLGGLIRTEAEHNKAVARAKEIKKRYIKNKTKNDKD